MTTNTNELRREAGPGDALKMSKDEFRAALAEIERANYKRRAEAENARVLRALQEKFPAPKV